MNNQITKLFYLFSNTFLNSTALHRHWEWRIGSVQFRLRIAVLPPAKIHCWHLQGSYRSICIEWQKFSNQPPERIHIHWRGECKGRRTWHCLFDKRTARSIAAYIFVRELLFATSEYLIPISSCCLCASFFSYVM